jgi:hypothetical protein
MLVEVSEPACPMHAAEEDRGTRGWRNLSRPAQVGVKDMSLQEIPNPRDPEAACAGKRTPTTHRMPALAERGSRDETGHNVATLLDSEERGEDGNPANEVPRPVDRINDQASIVPPSGIAEFLPQDSQARMPPHDKLARRLLDGAIRNRHGAEIGLLVHGQVWRPEVSQSDRIGLIRYLHEERQPHISICRHAPEPSENSTLW